MPRSIWKGSIAFGLVQIPVALYPAVKGNDLSFTMLDKRNFAPVGYERVNKKTGKKVQWDDIVKGYEYKKGKYVVLTDADFARANVRATQTIDILAFVDAERITPLYFDVPYLLGPTKPGRKAYALLREVLKREDKAGIAKVVIRTREHLAALLPQGDFLALVLMRFPNEFRDQSELDVPGENLKTLGVTPKELDMAKTLVRGMVDDWRPERYHDEYRDDLMRLIEKRAKQGDLNEISDEPAPKPEHKGAEIVDLAALLAQSVARGNKGGKKRGARPKKARPAARKGRAHRPLRKAG
jgi:DNA end-binding protein Ku